jgi:tRNA1(Val) A37 N6-methylase TrmN6
MIGRCAYWRKMKLSFRPEPFADTELSCDAFLGGALQIYQPVSGYRAGVDPVLLAACVTAKAGARVLELGCGGGIASLCLMRRVPGVRAVGVEVQPAYADLARRNAALNDLPLEVVCADLAELPREIKQQQFDHVFANPPYFDRSRSTAAQDTGRETGLGGGTDLSTWVHVAAKRLRPKGRLTMIQRIERLPEILTEVLPRLGSVEVLPLSGRLERAPSLLILKARKEGRADFRLHAQIALHSGAAHHESVSDYSPMIESVLREGAALRF